MVTQARLLTGCPPVLVLISLSLVSYSPLLSYSETFQCLASIFAVNFVSSEKFR